MTIKNKQFIDAIISRYKHNKNILGIMIFGSAVRGTFDKYSDVDFFVLTLRKYKYWRENFVEGDIRFDVIIDSKQRAIDDLKAERYKVRRNFSHMLAHGSIIYDINNELKKIKRTARRSLSSKTRFTREEALMHKYSIDDFFGEVKRYYSKRDWFAFELNLGLLINNILEFFLKLHGDYLRRPNELLKVMQQHDGSFAALFKSYCSVRNHHDKMKTIHRLVERIFTISHGFLPKQWHV